MTTPRTAKANTVVLAGDPESSNVPLIAAAIANVVSGNGRVAAGDLLEPKRLSEKTTLFHIGCYRQSALIDLISCPLTLRNAGIALSQANRVVWVLRPDSVGDHVAKAIRSAAVFGIQSHVVLVNSAGLDPDLSRDPELMAVMEAEVVDLFAAQDVAVELVAKSCVGNLDDVESGDEGVRRVANYLFDKWLDHRTLPGVPQEAVLVGVEQCYGVSGPDGKSTRVGYGPVKGNSIRSGQHLTLIGPSGRSEAVRVAQLQEFGQNVDSILPGSSAAVLCHGAPKDRPKVGDILTDIPDRFVLNDQLSVNVQVLSNASAAQALGGLSGLDLCIGQACVSCKIVDLVAGETVPNEGRLRLRSAQNVLALPGQPVLLGNGQHIVAWGSVGGGEQNA